MDPYEARLAREAQLEQNPYPQGTFAHRELEDYKAGRLYWQQPDDIGQHPW